MHLLIEKPISDVPDGVEHLINTCKNKNITLMVGYNLRFNPTLQEFRKSILQKKIGKVLSVKVEVGQYLPNWRPDSDYRKSVSAQKKLGGGVLLELSHEVDYIGWIFGKYSWVKSHISKQSDLEIDVEDSASMIFGLNINQGSEVVVSLNMDFIRHDSMRQCTVIGDEGSLRWDGIKGEVSIFQKNSKEWSLIFSQSTDRDYTYKCEISDFIAAIEKNKKVTITGQDGLKVVQVIDAIHQSYKNNTMIVL